MSHQDIDEQDGHTFNRINSSKNKSNVPMIVFFISR